MLASSENIGQTTNPGVDPVSLRIQGVAAPSPPITRSMDMIDPLVDGERTFGGISNYYYRQCGVCQEEIFRAV
jgi:hypothetical protein